MVNALEMIHTETEKSILKAAKLVFYKKGLAAARMQEIADEANINNYLSMRVADFKALSRR